MNKLIEERVRYLSMLKDLPVKTPSEAGGMWFSYRLDDAVTDPIAKEIESIGIFRGIEDLRVRIQDTEERRFRKVTKAVVDFTYRDLNNVCETFEPHEIIPILRPYSDLTDEECIALALQDGYDEQIIKGRPEAVVSNIRSIFNWKNKDLMLTTKMTTWLVKEGFDVWGWIEKEVALDKTKTKLPEFEHKWKEKVK